MNSAGSTPPYMTLACLSKLLRSLHSRKLRALVFTRLRRRKLLRSLHSRKSLPRSHDRSLESHLWRGGFPHSDICGSKLVCQLPAAFRRLPRPSSPVIAKASTSCTYSLDPITLITLASESSYKYFSAWFVHPAFCLKVHGRYNHQTQSSQSPIC